MSQDVAFPPLSDQEQCLLASTTQISHPFFDEFALGSPIYGSAQWR